MRPSTPLSLLLALTATHVVATPKPIKHHARSNATTSATTSIATGSTSAGCNYIHAIGPNPANPPIIYTGCACPSAPHRASIFNLSAAYPACTPRLDTALYPSVVVGPGDPGLALCEDWEAVPGTAAPDGTPPLVPPFEYLGVHVYIVSAPSMGSIERAPGLTVATHGPPARPS
ncbi:hypothetical protein HO173_004949 [Letharia columbiana]|uniref:Uncharacterized protein n=1 Tax=Letharia columbiana TaxID=112416 RepID=A0A8H6FXN1_9LECA|nr:uncharacterized protein HO173_004949 [Letharia columbiana]KAF6236658.1 hypothetical protein HO173_004949 [Letharia columbiana]